MVETKRRIQPEIVDRTLEKKQEKETERVKLIGTSVIAFSHNPGVGGSTLAEMLANKIEGSLFYDGGKQLRATQGYNNAYTEYMPRSIDVDRDIDQDQMDLMRNATPEEPVVINAKLSLFNAFKVMQEDPSINITTVVVTADQRTAAERIRKRTQERLQRKFQEYSQKVLSGEITNEEFEILLDKLRAEGEENTIPNIMADTKERRKRDLEQFAKAHPELKGVDIFSPGAKILAGYEIDPKTKKRKPIYKRLAKIKLSTSNFDEEEAREALIDKLIGLGVAKRVKPRSPSEGNKKSKNTESGDIYKSDSSKEIGEPLPARISSRSKINPNLPPNHPSRRRQGPDNNSTA